MTLIALAKIDRLSLLQRLYGNVLIPATVQREVTGLKPDLPGTREVSPAPWIKATGVSDQIAVSLLREQLDVGESKAIVLTFERQADLLLIDEARGRRIAQAKDLVHTSIIWHQFCGHGVSKLLHRMAGALATAKVRSIT